MMILDFGLQGHHLKARIGCRQSLAMIVCDQTANAQFSHGREMQPIKGAAMHLGPSHLPMDEIP